MAKLKITRKLGERRAVQIKVTYETPYNLATADIKFWLDAPDGTPKVEGVACVDAVDISASLGATAQTVWKLTYPFDADDLDELGRYTGEFEADFGGGFKEYYPTKTTFIEATVVAHPASTV